MRGSWGIWIGATLIALNALVLGQDLVAWHAAAATAASGAGRAFPVWPAVTLLVAVAYTAVATTVYWRGRGGGR